MLKFAIGLTGIVAVSLLASTPSQAAIVVNVAEVGSNVLVSTTGSINLTGLQGQSGFIAALGPIGIQGSVPALVSGGTQGTTVIAYTGLTGPTSFGTGGLTDASSSNGLSYAFLPADPTGATRPSYLFLPLTYTSGSAITSSATFDNATLASLGLTVGQYVWRSANDTLTINVLPPTTVPPVTQGVPEPATWAMMLIGFGMAGFAMRRRPVRVRYAV